MEESKLNLIDNPKGRKWSWGQTKWLGEFTTIDFFIVFFSLIIVTLAFTISIITLNTVNGIIIGITVFIIFLLLDLVLIKEWGGYKSYEMIYSALNFRFKRKDYSLGHILEDGGDKNE